MLYVAEAKHLDRNIAIGYYFADNPQLIERMLKARNVNVGYGLEIKEIMPIQVDPKSVAELEKLQAEKMDLEDKLAKLTGKINGYSH